MYVLQLSVVHELVRPHNHPTTIFVVVLFIVIIEEHILKKAFLLATH